MVAGPEAERAGTRTVLRLDVWLLAAGGAAIAFAALYIALDINKLHALRFGIDNGIFLQSLSNLVHGGSMFNWGEGRSHWLVHDSWILLILAPFVALFPTQETLIGAQVIVLAASAVGLYVFATAIGVRPPAAAILSVAFLLWPSTQGFAYADFSESHFEPLLIFVLATAVAKKNLPWSLLYAQLLMGVKEDVVLFLIWFGIIGAIWHDRRIGAAVAILATINAAIYYGIVLMQGTHPNAPPYGLYVNRPFEDLTFLVEILAPAAFLPLWLGRWCLVAFPLVVELFFANWQRFPIARTGTHYTEALVALVAIGTAVVLAKQPSRASWCLACTAIMALFFNPTVLHIGRRPFLPDPRFATLRAEVPTMRPMTFYIQEQGAWDIVAADGNARILHNPWKKSYDVPAWNTSR